MDQLLDVLARVRSRRSTQPLVIIADTIKGEGVESFCYQPVCHGIAPKGDDAKKALAELERRCSYE